MFGHAKRLSGILKILSGTHIKRRYVALRKKGGGDGAVIRDCASVPDPA